MYKNFLYILLLSCLFACDSLPSDWEWGSRPRPLNGVSGFPSAKTEYGRGFKDGCGIGWSSVGKGLISDFMPMELNTKLITQSADYRTGWWDGFEQCVYILDWDVI